MNDTIPTLLGPFRRSLLAANKSPATITTYMAASNLLHRFLVAAGRPTEVATIDRATIEDFLLHLRAKGQAPATVANRYRSLQQFFKYLVEEELVTASPMTSMPVPKVPVVPPDVLTPEELQRLFDRCAGTTFLDRRDNAIIHVLADTGCRRSEVAGMRLADVDLDNQHITVLGKGSRIRLVPYGNDTGRSLDRYLRARKTKAVPGETHLWLGPRGPLDASGLAQMLKRRSYEAGIRNAHPHLWRHSWAHALMASQQVPEHDIMRLAGWRSPAMLSRYGASAAQDRALRAYRQNSPIDRLKADRLIR